ncbi:MAG: RHS repeat protein [Myxococcales bacterium]|nr:RHS repeat protein [Myxococcales bacterium]
MDVSFLADWVKRELFGPWERLEVTDTLGRLTEVHEGFVGATVRTGAYVYDGRDRILELEDGNQDRWRYRYDLAGRVEQVGRSDGGAVFEDYVGYDWNGPDPSCMYEGTRGASGCVVLWTYDDLGRTTTKTMVDPSGTVTTGWAWDRDPNNPLSEWLGVRHATFDLSGSTTYAYDAGPFGRLGQLTGTTRTFNGGTTASFARTYDSAGNVLTETWPSGRTVARTYHDNGELSSASVSGAPGGPTYDVDVTYDAQYGLPDGYALTAISANGSFTVDATIERNTSTQVSDETWVRSVGGAPLANQTVAYLWGEGLLRAKQVNSSDPISYTYDGLRRIDAVYGDANIYVTPAATPFETYQHDVAGNPTVTSARLPAAQGGGQQGYTYDPSPEFSEVGFRSHTGAQTVDRFAYDAVSRLTSWNTEVQGQVTKARTFQYDGAGRLRVQGGATPVDYRYDVDDQLVEEVRGSPANPSVVRRFEGWRWQQTGNVTTEQVLPMLRLSGPLATVVATEPDGHAVLTVRRWEVHRPPGGVLEEGPPRRQPRVDRRAPPIVPRTMGGRSSGANAP